jgi:hypothetical protein
MNPGPPGTIPLGVPVFSCVHVCAISATGFAGLPRVCIPLRVSIEPYCDAKDRTVMPGKKHLRGVSAKEQREYEHIKEDAERSGRYGSRAKEVAVRTVMKQHKAKGHGAGK